MCVFVYIYYIISTYMYINKKQNKHIVSMYMFNKWKKKLNM